MWSEQKKLRWDAITVTNNSKYYSKVEVDENGDLVLPLPDELLEELGWTTDTVIDFESHDDYFTLRKVNEHEEQNH
jgi:hypothetical protein